MARRTGGRTVRIAEYLDRGGVIADLASLSGDDALAELVTRAARLFPEIDRDGALRLLREREQLGSTAVGDGVALPHAKLEELHKPLVVFGRSRTGIAFNALDGRPVRVFFLLLTGTDSVAEHLGLLAGISRLLKNRAFRDRLLEAADAKNLHDLIVEQDSRT